MRSRKGGKKPRRQMLQVLVHNILKCQHAQDPDFCPDCGVVNCKS